MLFEFSRVTLEHPSARVTVVRELDLVVEEGELLVLSGPSGCGKSTVLNAMAGFVPAASGRITYRGRDLSTMGAPSKALYRNSEIGMIHQGFNLIADLGAAENVMLPLLIRGTDATTARRASAEMLERLGMAHRSRHRPSQMSGGEQQRVAIGRALVAGPRVVLADEPTGNLDAAATSEFLSLLMQLRTSERITVVLVTHDPSVAAIGTRRIDFGGRVPVTVAGHA